MNIFFCHCNILVAGLLTFLATGIAAEPADSFMPTAAAGSFEVAVSLGEWVDEAREGRKVPWKLYFPGKISEPAPVVFWSHGAGGSREGGEYLGRFLSSHGFAAFHIQHPGTDESLIRDDGARGMLERMRNPRATMARFGDMPFAVRQLKQMNASGEWAGKFDVGHMGVSGHSFGAMSTLIAAGQRNQAVGDRFVVAELKGAFAMSPSARGGSPEELFAEMVMPIFHLTGTNDQTPLRDFEPKDRQIPFETIDGVDQYLIVMEEATHRTFSGRPDPTDPALDRHHELIRLAALAFWTAYLKEDQQAQDWLVTGMAKEMQGEGTYRVKRPDR